jgi:diguanylate cyclase (GGDEF)-like protein
MAVVTLPGPIHSLLPQVGPVLGRWSPSWDGALRNPLTNLPNRALLLDRLSHALDVLDRRAGAAGDTSPAQAYVGVLFLDLDRFKDVNDAHGHLAGDQALCVVAHRLRARLRATNTVARIGGDEFAVVLEDLGGHGADERAAAAATAGVADALVAEVARPMTLNGATVHIGVSVGVVVGNRADGADALLGNADAAMYAAKRVGGGGSRTFDGPLRAGTDRRRRLFSELRAGLDGGELRLSHEAIVRLDDRVPAGLAAACAWQRFDGAPIEFHALEASPTGTASVTGWAGWRSARASRPWRPLANGVSTWAGSASPWSARTSSAAASSTTSKPRAPTRDWAPPRSSWRSVTARLHAHSAFITECRSRLEDLGVALAVRGFGRDGGPLRSVLDHPLEFVTVDPDLAFRPAGRSGSLSALQALAELSAGLQTAVIVAGIETDDQAAWARQAGCHLGRGPLFSGS